LQRRLENMSPQHLQNQMRIGKCWKERSLRALS
jgi:hypothetical protein